MTWDEYLSQSQDYPPRPLLVESLSYLKEKKNALDLGCGAMNDTRLLLKVGFNRVDAVDSNPSVQKVAETIPEYDTRLFFHNKTFKEFSYLVSNYDLINAQYSLPFMSPEDFDMVWPNIAQSLVSGGIINGQFFGTEDGWAKLLHMTFMTKEQIVTLFPETKWELIKLQEEKKQGKTAAGQEKFWHVFHIIARKK